MSHPLQGVTQICESILCEALGEDVHSFICRWEILQWYHLLMHQDPDVVHVYLNVLGRIYLYWIGGCLDCTFIFTPNDSGWIKWKTKFSKNALQPHRSCSCIHYSYVLSLNWWKGYISLFLNLPSYGTMWKNEYITLSVLSVSGISIPIKISKPN